MARVKLSEYRAKSLVYSALGMEYEGVSVDAHDSVDASVASLPEMKYAVKVDQAIKKRNKLGLVRLQRAKAEVAADIQEWVLLGYRYFLVEPIVDHAQKDEHFLAVLLTEDGIEFHYSSEGGVNIEDNADSIKKYRIEMDAEQLAALGPLDSDTLQKIRDVFLKAHMVYLEINPLFIKDGRIVPLDAAVEVDTAAIHTSDKGWDTVDLRYPAAEKHASELQVEALQASSPSSLTLRVLNPNGSIFLLLSGGGASVVIADELGTYEFADALANYGEYSGNPTEEEVYLYTSAIITLLKESSASSKALIIAGGIANFTDIASSFRGIIRALDAEKKYFKANEIGVYVRRGGPNQQRGLRLIKDFLTSVGIKNQVVGPEVSIGSFIKSVAEDLQ